MSKRFTETDKWKDSWFRTLSVQEKLLWLYIIDNCDNAGFFELDIGMCAFFTGLSSVEILGAIKGLDRGLIGAIEDGLYYVKNFLRHQKNEALNPANNAHKQIIKIMESKSCLFDVDLGAKQGLLSPIGKGIGKGIGKEVVIQSDNYTDDFESLWNAYPKKTGKLQAFRYFEATPKPSISKLLEVINTQKKSRDWTEDHGKYIPSLSTWIKDCRWNDILDPIKSDSPSVDIDKILKGYV